MRALIQLMPDNELRSLRQAVESDSLTPAGQHLLACIGTSTSVLQTGAVMDPLRAIV